MVKSWDYQLDLKGGMIHSLQVQTDEADVDFNVYVLDPSGVVLAKDEGPEAGAECSFVTTEDTSVIVRIELASGSGGFSLTTSSRRDRAQDAPEPEADFPDDEEKKNEGPGLAREPASREIGLSPSEIVALLEAHNDWRARYRVPPLCWSDELAAHAQEWADLLAMEGMRMRHRSPNAFGENLYCSAGKASTPAEVVDAWGNEVEFYDHKQNNWWPKAGHFSQVVWSTTTELGGGVVRRDGEEIWVCNYNPRGNWTGQRPY